MSALCCYGYHAGSIPKHADEVVDTQGRHYLRAGPRSWTQDVPSDQPARIYEPWLLEHVGPVRCPTSERMMARRDQHLLDQLVMVDETRVRLPESSDLLEVEQALDLMRAGWLAWNPKQRREALAVTV